MMKREAIANLLVENYKQFTGYLEAMPDEDFIYAQPDKWCAGLQLDHLVRSIGPVLFASRLPGILLWILFGKPNRPVRSYDELVSRYRSKLDKGGRASGRFVPEKITPAQKQGHIADLTRLVTKLAEQVSRMPEEKLDSFLLPHPLLGKLTLREMMYFTAYHALHHLENVKRGLEGRL